MADLTVLSFLEPVPMHPSLHNGSRSLFSSYDGSASSSKISLHLTVPNKMHSARSPLSDSDSIYSIPEQEESESGSESLVESPTAEHHGQPIWTSDPSCLRGRAGLLTIETVSSIPFSPTPSPLHGSPSSSRSYTSSTRDSDPDDFSSPTPSTSRPPTRHHPTRSRSAPPELTRLNSFLMPPERDRIRCGYSSTGLYTPTSLTPHTPRTQRGYSTCSDYGSPPRSSTPTNSWSFEVGSRRKGGELLRPPPPLHRPTTFWRRTPRSGVTASSYSPSSHVIRRSTFIAAGLPFDRPMADLSALGVECRIRNDQSRKLAKVQEMFWEVIL